MFGAKDMGVATGVEGRVTYELKRESSPTLFIDLYWKNPFVGSNSAGAMVYTRLPALPGGLPGLVLPQSDDYRVLVTYGAGDQDVEMRYTLLPAD